MFEAHPITTLEEEKIKIGLTSKDKRTVVKLEILPSKDDTCCGAGWYLHLDAPKLHQLAKVLTNYAGVVAEVENARMMKELDELMNEWDKQDHEDDQMDEDWLPEYDDSYDYEDVWDGEWQ